MGYERSAGGVLNRVLLNDEQLTRHHYQNGLETARKQGDILSRFDHDEQGRLTAHTQHQNGRQTQSRNYQYGADGNLTEVADSRFGTVFYDYDPLSRLQKTRGVVEESFAHDPAGNLLDQVIGAQAGKKPFDVEGNQLKFHGDSHYEYDEFGRLIAEKRGKDQRLVTNYDYDCQHRLVKASLPDGSFAHYKYDAFGRRIEKKVTDKLGTEKTTEFVWQGDTLIAETSSEHYQTYVYEPGTFKPMAMLSGEGADCEVYHYHLDQIGTPTDITDLHGKSVWSVQYRAYGNVLRKHVEEISSPLRFQGQYFDEETGLHYNRHRYYSPSTGRFVTADPIGLAGGLNNYQYVPNPTGWVDPLGLANTKVCGPCEPLTAAEKSASYQGEDPYFGVDPLTNVSLPKGQRLAHITWKQNGEIAGNYFTTPNAVELSRAKDGLVSSKALNQGVQVYAGDGRTDYKKYVQIYEVSEEIPLGGVAKGATSKKPQFNPGRYRTHEQYFILDEHLSKLTAVRGSLETMKNTEAPDISEKLERLRRKHTK